MHINKINQKRYIGITREKPEYRWGKNGKRYIASPHFYNAIQKYGWDNFEHVIYKENLTKNEAFDMERNLIKEYKTTDENYGYNISEGGDCPNAEYLSKLWDNEEFKKKNFRIYETSMA